MLRHKLTRPLSLAAVWALAATSAASQSVVHQITGDPADRFGNAVAGLGDVNGDGYGDFAAGAHRDDPNGTDSGSVTIYSGFDGAVLHFIPGNSANDRFGFSVDSVPDTNGDGIRDLVVGAILDASFKGSATLYAGGTWAQLQQWVGTTAGWSAWGTYVHGMEDVDGDGRGDVLVSSEDEPTNNTGTVRLYSGATGAVIHEWSGIGVTGESFGASCAPAGDLDADGVPDVLIFISSLAGAFGDHRLRAYSGATGLQLHEWLEIKVGGGASASGNGPPMATLGDVDADGHDDFAARCLNLHAGFPDAHVVHVVSGADGSVMSTFGGLLGGEYVGYSVAGPGDLDGDGVPDLALGAPQAGNAMGYIAAFSLADGSELFRVWGEANQNRLGEAMRPAGDVNGDGLPDLIAGAPSLDGAYPGGFVRVLSGVCAGSFATYGAGHPGTGGVTPGFRGNGCPGQGYTPQLIVEDGVGAGLALLPLALAPAAIPFKGGTLLIDPVGPFILTLPLGGAPGAAGAGSGILPTPLPIDPLLDGLNVFAQAVIADAGASKGFAMSAGLQISID
jgi:hypothetical protein